jgi:hypothetical protein
MAAGSAHLAMFSALLVVGLIVALFGHIIHSRPLIVTGLVVIAGVSAYFSFVLQPTGR